MIKSRGLGLTLLLVFAVFALGCGGREIVGPDLPPAPLPTYEVGTSYVYSDGRWETVSEVDGDTVTWVNYRGYPSVGSADFIYKRSQWRTKTRKGERRFSPRGIFWVEESTLWPLKVGNRVDFRENGAWRKKDGPLKRYKSFWSCEVVGTERVSVMAGEFDTWVIRGRRLSSKGKKREVKTWYYAPEVGHVVLVERRLKSRKHPIQKELLAVVAPRKTVVPEVRLVMEDNLQKALELNKAGASETWSDTGSGLSGETIPIGTFRLDDGTFCRNYIQKLDQGDGEKIYHGMACRSSKGRWLVPHK